MPTKPSLAELARCVTEVKTVHTFSSHQAFYKVLSGQRSPDKKAKESWGRREYEPNTLHGMLQYAAMEQIPLKFHIIGHDQPLTGVFKLGDDYIALHGHGIIPLSVINLIRPERAT